MSNGRKYDFRARVEPMKKKLWRISIEQVYADNDEVRLSADNLFKAFKITEYGFASSKQRAERKSRKMLKKFYDAQKAQSRETFFVWIKPNE